MHDCPQCGRPFEPNEYSGDFCPACADAVRSELSPRVDIAALRQGLSVLPFVTFLLVGVNVAVFIAFNSFARPWARPEFESLFNRLVMENESVLKGEWWRLLTGIFLHLSWPDLASNVVLLLSLGWRLERRLGHTSLFVLWLGGGLFGSLAALLLEGLKVASIGSSGVAFGFLGAWLGLYAFGRLPMPPTRRLWRSVLLAALLSLWIFAEWLLRGRINTGHLGGAVAGILLGASLPLGGAFSWKRLLSVYALALLAIPLGLALAHQVHAADLELDKLMGSTPEFFDPPAGLIPEFARIVASHPNHVRANLLLAGARSNAHQYAAAIDSYRKVVALQPNIPRAWYGLGIALASLHQFPEAADAFSRSADLDPNNFLTDEMLAVVFDALGRRDDAMKAVHRVCTLRPKLCEGIGEQQYLERLRSTRDSMFGPNNLEPR